MTSAAAALFTLILGPWFISWNADQSLLTLENKDQNVVFSGQFHCENDKGPLSVIIPFDNTPNQLALADQKGVILACISFQQNGNELSFLIHPRITKLLYPARFRFDGILDFRSDGFACRYQPRTNESVVFMGSGKSDSKLNDSVFSPENDLLVRFFGSGLDLRTLDQGKFQVHFEDRICGSYGLRIFPNYYKSRWVPYYTPINRKRCPSPPTGWMSWNVYFDQAGARENLEEARLGKKYLQPFGLEFWSIESWQENSDKIPVADFHNLDLKPHPKQFPDGMKKLADEIRALGFRPGIWYVPWGTGSKEFYLAHKDWFLHEADGSPVKSWAGNYTLDPSHPEVRKHTKEKLRTASREWGYEFFKIDGMAYNPRHAPYHFERPDQRSRMKCPKAGNPYENFVRDFREAIGEDRIFLTCRGTITGPEVQFADASRIGADIVKPGMPVGWDNLVDQGFETLRRLFTHNIIYYNDPDTLLVNKSLSLEEARLTTTVVSLPGQMMFSGDRLGELPHERMALLQKALPVCDVYPMDLYPIETLHSIWDLKIRRSFLDWDVAALFNWTEKEKKIGFSFEDLGLDPNRKYAVYEYWTDHFCGTVQKRFSIDVPAHAVRLLAVHPIQNRPQFLSSSRHTTQGGVDLTDLVFTGKTLKGKVKLVGGNTTILRFLLPSGWICEKADSDVSVNFHPEENGQIIALHLTSKKTQEASFEIKFND
ncbi:MAG: alpha-galactosidase [Planctomycetia bacterium]|nr:alpha-galactosidase [Planctomycetia bacterium]